MTVEKLISQLEKVEDKTKEVMVCFQKSSYMESWTERREIHTVEEGIEYVELWREPQ